MVSHSTEILGIPICCPQYVQQYAQGKHKTEASYAISWQNSHVLRVQCCYHSTVMCHVSITLTSGFLLCYLKMQRKFSMTSTTYIYSGYGTSSILRLHMHQIKRIRYDTNFSDIKCAAFTASWAHAVGELPNPFPKMSDNIHKLLNNPL